ncbi:methyl-accepting chemotaxis protein [Tropicimonas sp. TH_r6]|uniref:methyl-accepting chemotaxis protein n=1 Tax=Tropicimonas sp. TH_r6 TaxID=3082085 RepID=UPI002954CF89|nr:methyl-accepting chemotaxis protein [Tropicimonas sp. TH_r6]MDV7145222.1 methyl-accepting chemotaxis protein [Tropicimonas sp. TH_r6]
MLKNIKLGVGARIYAIVVAAILVTIAIGLVINTITLRNSYALRELHLRDVVDVTVSQLAALDAEVQAGELPREEAIEQGIKLVNDASYDNGNYLFAFDQDLSLYAHGRNPDRRGENVSGFSDPNGVKVYVELGAVAKAEGSGFVSYSAKRKGDDSGALRPKLSFARAFEPWGWVIATGSYIEDIEAQIASVRNLALIALGAGIMVLAAFSWGIARSITGPLSGLVGRMQAMREDDLESDVPHTAARSELGLMARSIDVFREQLVERKRLEKEQAEKDTELAREREESLQQKLAMEKRDAEEAERRRADEERQRIEREEQRSKVEAEREARRAEQAKVVAALSSSLSAMSKGDLSSRIEDRFPEDYEELRRNFNDAIERISSLVRAIVEGSQTINGESDTLSNAATEMSRRTESQAASLEQTAAAITELSASVDSSSKGAHEATSTVVKAREKTEVGREVVEQTIASMSEIAESSGKISKITNVIDDIAFQTNLLALNAGVEAARAGEAGRGFSVVASEVRALAQRSSEAAKEIAELINTSGQQVETGVTLVKNSGEALQEIQGMVMSLNELVAAVADASTQQSTTLSEITTAVNRLDQVTQQNAAMFEETTAAVSSLQAQAGALDRNSASFRLGRENVLAISHESSAATPNAGRKAPAVAKAVNETVSASTSATPETDLDDGWADF